MCPLPLLVVVAVKFFGVVTARAETRSVCNDSNLTVVSVSMDICTRIKYDKINHFAVLLPHGIFLCASKSHKV